MDMDQAAVFLAGSILTALGFLVILATVVIANNIIHKYWKNLGWSWLPHWANEPSRFASQEELARIVPHLEEAKKDQKAEK